MFRVFLYGLLFALTAALIALVSHHGLSEITQQDAWDAIAQSLVALIAFLNTEVRKTRGRQDGDDAPG